MADEVFTYILACLLRPIVGGNPILDNIIKKGIEFIGLPAVKPSSAETERRVETPKVEEIATEKVRKT